MTSDATVMSKPASRGTPWAMPPSEMTSSAAPGRSHPACAARRWSVVDALRPLS